MRVAEHSKMSEFRKRRDPQTKQSHLRMKVKTNGLEATKKLNKCWSGSVTMSVLERERIVKEVKFSKTSSWKWYNC